MASSSSSYTMRQSSSRNFSTGSVGYIGGMLVGGGGQSRMSRSSAASMYAGYSGGVSVASTVPAYLDSSSITLASNEKLTMQNLNDRLASYLDKVRTLEAANRKLELQIKQFYETKAPGVARDLSGYFATITELRVQILRTFTENQSITLQIDNAQMAAEDFKSKQEMEMTMRVNAEADINRLRGFKESLSLSIGDLKLQLEGLKEELAYIKSNHEEEKRLLRTQVSCDVNVEVDAKSNQVDLAKVMEEMREQYETMMLKNKKDQEKWFNSQMETLQSQITTSTTEVRTYTSELSELKKTYQTLEISLQSVIKELECLQRNLEEVNARYGIQLSQYQMTITSLEAELQELKLSVEKQQTEYQLLLDIKMRLEMEIAEYRRLLEGEIRTTYEEKKVVVTKVVEEPPKPKVEERVTIIREQVINGKVVSSVVDTQTENVR